MGLIFLVVFEIRVARSWIESRSGLRLMRGDQRFLKSNFIGGIVCVTPVVAVISEGDDRLCRIEVVHSADQVLLKPVLRGHRTRVTTSPVLVVSHHDQIIAGCGVGFVIPVGIVERYGLSNQQTLHRELRV